MFNPATLFMYVPVQSQEPLIQWLSFVYAVHICFSFIFFIQIMSLVFSFELFYIVISGPFIADYAVWALLIVEGRTMTYSCKCLCHFGFLWIVVSLAIIPHLLFYIII